MKKIHILWFILILSFILFLIFIFLPKDYTKKYENNKIKISETYNKKSKSYYFTFNYKGIELNYLIESGYKQQRKLIDSIDIIEDEKDNFCLEPKGEKLKFIPLCYQDKKATHYNLINNELKNKLSTNLFSKENKIENYNDIEIYNKDRIYLIWNYDGFYYISNKEKKKIDIFEKESYNINLIGYTKEFLVIADYDSNYTFNNFYTIDFKKGNLKKWELDRNIYFDSYYIGYLKNKLYIVDNKEISMYEFDAKKGELEKIKSKILKKNKWENVKIKTLINKKQEFEYNSNYKFFLEDNNLYMNYTMADNKILVAENIKNIVRINDADIYYLKSDSLYHFNNLTGEEKLLSYFEWNFNYENMIYIN